MNSGTGPPNEKSAQPGALSENIDMASLHTDERSASRLGAIPWQLSDVTKIYDAELITNHLPAPYPPELKLAVQPWFDGTTKFALQPYMRNMRKHFRDLLKADERGPFDLIFKLTTHTGGIPWSPILACWIGELLSCVYPKDDSKQLEIRVTEAMRDPGALLSAGVGFGYELWNKEKLSRATIHARINNWLADHCAAHIYHANWIRRQVWPQTSRSAPTATEKRMRDVMTQWGSISAEDAVFGAQIERTFGITPEKYNPDHPLSYRVKIETPVDPVLGQKPWILMFSVSPLIRHHQWSAADVCRVLVILRPDLASQWATRKQDSGPEYVRRQILGRIGMSKVTPGRRKSREPIAFNFARLMAEQLQRLPHF